MSEQENGKCCGRHKHHGQSECRHGHHHKHEDAYIDSKDNGRQGEGCCGRHGRHAHGPAEDSGHHHGEGCGHGHHEHHEHGPDCGHGHSDEHHHSHDHHEHGPDCNCGHGQHHHEHTADCGHHHGADCDCGHDHEHLYSEDGQEPAVYSFTREETATADGAAIAAAYHAVVENLCAWARERDLLVGHIKLFLTRGDEGLWISSTGDELSRRMSEHWDTCGEGGYTLNFTAIVYGPSTEELTQRADALLREKTGTL